MGEDASLHFYAALAHPNPVIPNMHVQEKDLQLNVDMEVDGILVNLTGHF